MPKNPKSGQTKVRWGEPERELAKDYFRGNKGITINHKKLQDDAAYRRKLQRREPLWARHPNKNFDQNMKRHSEDWEAAQAVAGTRKKKAVKFDDEKKEDNDNEEESTESSPDGNETDFESAQEELPDGEDCLPLSYYFSLTLTI